MEIASKSPLFAYLQQYPCPPSTYPSQQAQRPPIHTAIGSKHVSHDTHAANDDEQD